MLNRKLLIAVITSISFFLFFLSLVIIPLFFLNTASGQNGGVILLQPGVGGGLTTPPFAICPGTTFPPVTVIAGQTYIMYLTVNQILASGGPPPINGKVGIRISTEGSNYDTVMWVIPYPLFNSPIAYDDDSGSSSTSVVYFVADVTDIRATYLIAINPKSGNHGVVQIIAQAIPLDNVPVGVSGKCAVCTDIGLRVQTDSGIKKIGVEPTGTTPMSSLRIAKDGTTYGVCLVPSGNPSSTGIRINSNGTLMDVREY